MYNNDVLLCQDTNLNSSSIDNVLKECLQNKKQLVILKKKMDVASNNDLTIDNFHRLLEPSNNLILTVEMVNNICNILEYLNFNG